MPYRLAIFDFDGTLADSFPWFSRVVNDVADRYRFKRIEPHEFDELRMLDARALMRRQGVAPWKVPFIAHHMRRRKAKELDQTRLFDGVGPMLSRLSDAGIGLALVSSNSERNICAILGTEIARRFHYYECGVSLFCKSSRFGKVLRRSGTLARDAICIGDEIRDLDAARRQGIAFGAVTWGYTAPDGLIARSPDVVFRSVDEIANRLAARHGGWVGV
jgi:phosphoglycolate phosphatase